MELKTVSLPERLEGAVSSGHPWIYRDHLPPNDLTTGDWVRAEAGRAVAFGLYDEHGAIGLRLFSKRSVPDQAWWRTTLRRALARREPLAAAGHDAYRLLHGEGDGVPGLVADRYGRFAVLQPHTASLETHLPHAARFLTRELGLKGVVRRVHGELEVLAGETPPPEETVNENDLRFLANLREGQKTGLFLDHRDHRAAVRDLAHGRAVLNLFAYTGGFSVHALAGGARSAWSVDRAAPALRDAERNVALNDLPAGAHHTVQGDVFSLLSRWASEDRRFDMVIVDPPSMARSKRQRARALAAYRTLNEHAARLLVPGGLLATASCTAQVSENAFEEAVRAGLSSAGRRGRLLRRGGQPLDHPVRPSFPEGRYLKFLIFEVDAA